MVRKVGVDSRMENSSKIELSIIGLQSILQEGKELLRERKRVYNRRYAERHPERVIATREKQRLARRIYQRKYNRDNKEDIKVRRDLTAQRLHFDNNAMRQRYDDYCRMTGRVVDIYSSEYLDGIEDWKVNIDDGGRGNAEWYMSHFESPKERDAYCQHCRRKGLPYKIGEEGCLDELENWRATSRKYGKKKENDENV